MARMAIVLTKNSNMLRNIENRIETGFEFERVDSGNPRGNRPKILINFGLINKRPADKVEQVAQTLALDETPDVKNYGLVDVRRIESITIKQLSNDKSRGMSY